MPITIHLPVKSYVYKYCRTMFGVPGKPFDHWHLTVHSKESKMLYALLERAPKRYEKLRTNEMVLNVFLTDKIIRTKGCLITQEGIDIFNDYIKQVVMDEILFFHTGIHSKIGLKAIDKITIAQYQSDKMARVIRLKPEEAQKFFWQKSIIYDILGKYEITEDEISFESVVKHLQRNGKSQLSA